MKTYVTKKVPARYHQDYASQYTRSDTIGTIVYGSYHGTPARPYLDDIRNSENDPDWKVLIAKGSDASHYYQRCKAKKCISHYWKARSHGLPSGDPSVRFDSDSYYNAVPALDNLGLIDDSDDAALKDIALARLKNKLQSHSGQMNTLIPLVEIRELRGLIRTSVTSLAMLVNSLIHIKRTRGKSAGRFAADMWLNYSFALKPTLSDIPSVAASISEALLGPKLEEFTDFGMSKKMWLTSKKIAGWGGYGQDIVTTHSLLHTLSYRYEATGAPKVFAANDYSPARAMGFEMGAILPAIWELMAYSWLVDYFGTVGAWLDDTFITKPYDTKFVILNKRYRCQITTESSPSLWPSTQSCDFNQRQGIIDISRFWRTALSQLPCRQLRFKTTDEMGKSGVNKVLNLASVLIGARHRSTDWHYK